MRVLAHMNQPHGSCDSYINELVRISSALSLRRVHPHRKSAKSREQQNIYMDAPSVDNTTTEFDVDFLGAEGEHSMVQDQSMPYPSHPETQPEMDTDESMNFTEEYSGASQVYGKGHTFMDNFHMDSHANERHDNLYYPFASRDEWEIASFLLRSSLSMSAIDQFLSLQLVSTWHTFAFIRFLFFVFFRFDKFNYHFGLQRNYVVARRCYQRALSGIASRGSQSTLPRHLLTFSIVTPLNVCNPSSTVH
jgi:hypothetical protein